MDANQALKIRALSRVQRARRRKPSSCDACSLVTLLVLGCAVLVYANVLFNMHRWPGSRQHSLSIIIISCLILFLLCSVDLLLSLFGTYFFNGVSYLYYLYFVLSFGICFSISLLCTSICREINL